MNMEKKIKIGMALKLLILGLILNFLYFSYLHYNSENLPSDMSGLVYIVIGFLLSIGTVFMYAIGLIIDLFDPRLSRISKVIEFLILICLLASLLTFSF